MGNKSISKQRTKLKRPVLVIQETKRPKFVLKTNTDLAKYDSTKMVDKNIGTQSITNLKHGSNFRKVAVQPKLLNTLNMSPDVSSFDYKSRTQHNFRQVKTKDNKILSHRIRLDKLHKRLNDTRLNLIDRNKALK